MAILRESINLKQSDGSYVTVHRETDGKVVLLESGGTLDAYVTANDAKHMSYLPEVLATDLKPSSLPRGMIKVGLTKVYAGGSSVITLEPHPPTKVCTGGDADTVDGFHIQASATDITAGSALGNGIIYLVYE